MDDPELHVIGYQPNFKKFTTGLFYFNHSCGSTLAIPASYFVDLYHGPVFQKRATGSDHCPEHCLRKEDLEPCLAECECAYIREVLQIIKTWPKA
ncbi:hypothetical protein DSCA_56890 [Desulfosarcina alkanivorans]|uniref:Uncharacterized protein n=1 Tax=Desulfosarcina alkanivorans TaxID=571177 RepID=A0A5K7YUR0_9BACT|nr:hypothetical protein DSCA_56890 [Desulfosarcina alkanivorans]